MASERPRMSEQQARAVLREYPDADLSAFDVDGDPDRLATEEAARSLGQLAERIGEPCRCGAREHVDCVCHGAEAHAGTCPAVTIGRRYSRTGRLLGVIAWAEPERCACAWPAVVREEVGRG